MTIYARIISVCWILFMGIWAVAAIGAKPSVGLQRWRRQRGVRLLILALILISTQSPSLRRTLWSSRLLAPGGAFAGATGVALCALGIGLAVWARIHLGRNWGMPMSQKEDPELVTSGPYKVIRHPIYTGMLLAMLGSAIALSWLWLAPLVLFGGYFIYSARAEEKLMLEQFPERYSAYMNRTKMIFPYVL